VLLILVLHQRIHSIFSPHPYTRGNREVELMVLKQQVSVSIWFIIMEPLLLLMVYLSRFNAMMVLGILDAHVSMLLVWL